MLNAVRAASTAVFSVHRCENEIEGELGEEAAEDDEKDISFAYEVAIVFI